MLDPVYGRIRAKNLPVPGPAGPPGAPGPSGADGPQRLVARTGQWNIKGSSTVPLLDVVVRRAVSIKVLAARIVYDSATSGSDGATCGIGKAPGDDHSVASLTFTQLSPPAAVGDATPMALADPVVPAGAPLVAWCWRSSGAAGTVHLEVEYDEVP